MARVLRIDPDGTVTATLDDSLLKAANREFDGRAGILTCAAPFLHEHSAGTWVLAVHDEGWLLDMPVNRKAWALYGRSPLVGVAFLALDGSTTQPMMPGAVPDIIRQDLTNWPIPTASLEAMDRILSEGV